MTVLTFPTNPTNGQLYNAPNGIRYVYDGVKWVVETTTSTSEAVTNSTQDRVAPMLVAGPHTGIAFTYNAGTNALSASVTAVNSDTLVNGVHEFTLESNGTLTLDGEPFTGVSVSDFGEGFTDSLDAGKITTSKLYNENPNQGLNNLYVLEVTNGGVVALPDGSIINGATLKTIAGNYAGITAGPASPAGRDEDSWVWVDNNGATIATKYSTDAHTWTFDNDGTLTLPAAGIISNTDGITLETGRGILAIGTNMEVPGIAQHFHIAFDGSNSQANANDLFLGDDYNYVKLPGYQLNPDTFGVEIGTDSRGIGPQNVEVDTVDELVPPGGVWRLFIIVEDYPNLGSAISVGDTVTTSWGTPITATITDVVEDNGDWQIHVAQDITAGFNDGTQTVSFGSSGLSYTWRFGTDGDLAIPPGKTIRDAMTGDDLLAGAGGDIGDIVVEVDSEYTKLTLANKDFTLETTRTGGQDADINIYAADDIFIEANGDDISLSAADQVRINTGDFSGDPGEYPVWTFDNVGDLTIPGNIKSEGNIDIEINLSDSTLRRWQFGEDGNLTLPTGGDILDSEGNSVLGGGATGDANVWVQTFVSNTPLTDFPQIATSVEYDSDGNVIGLFSHYDDSNDSTYFSVGKYTPAGTKIWTARLSDDIQTDGWGLAVDSADGWIYVAGQSDGVSETYPYDQATLTKIDPVNGSYDWHRVYDFGYASASAVVDVDSDGNPIMVGYVDVGGNGNESYLAVTKISKTDGTVLWSRKLDGQADEEAYGMAVGPNDEVVAVGYMSQLAYGANNATVTVATVPGSNGSWVTALTTTIASVDLNITFNAGVPTITVVEDLIGGRTIGVTLGTILGSALGGVDGVDDMIVNVATISGVGDQDDRIVVVKYNSSGAIQWQRAIQFDAELDCNGADADIDSLGNIYICGQYDVDVGPGGTGMALIKFNSAGVKQWSRRVVGNCLSTATSIVVGPDDKLYISGVNGDDVAEKFYWVVAKYSLDGLVEWQRFVENTTSWTFAGQFFNSLAGGSNIAVRQDYVALSGGFGNLNDSEQTYATLVQVPATGDVFTVGNWDFRAANLSGLLNSSASDITVIDAGLTDSDNAGAIEGGPIVGDTEVGNFLIGTLYTAPGGNNSLVNGGNQLTLETTGAVTLPQGGTITEGYVTSNPTIQLTPASPSVASQKLVIKGGTNYTFTDNGITLLYQFNTALPGATLDFYIGNAITYANQTLYWWIYPGAAGLTTPSSGTIALNGSGNSGEESISFVVDSDAYEFTVRVSPENNNYDPESIGVESGLINADEPTFEGEHHLHLTTGNLEVTSIILGTDDHNVRTTTNGNIEITTPGETNRVWEFDTAGDLTIPGNIRSEGNIDIEINLSDSTQRKWSFGEDGDLTFPDNTVQTTAYTGSTLTTVAKTGVILPTTTGIPLTLSGGMTELGVADGTYGPITKGGVTFSVTVTGGGISGYINISSSTSYAVNSVIGVLASEDLGDPPGQTTNINVDSVVQATPTAIDLTKSINKLTDGVYSLADGVEGQIMYLVGQTGAISTEVGVTVANYRVNGSENTGGLLLPFRVYDYSDESYYDSFSNICTLIFTDGAWQQTGGAWD